MGASVTPGEAELRVSFAPGCDGDAAVAAAAELLRREGVVVLDDIVDPALVADCRSEVIAGYPDMERVDRERNYGSYPGRHTVPVTVTGTLAEPAIFLPAPVARVAKIALGKAFKVDSFGLLVAVPGAPEQARHPDALLFPEQGIDRVLPAFAIAVALPLVAMDEISGTTAFWRGSHRAAQHGEASDLAPTVKPGSAILWDFRIQHCGLANRGPVPRLVLFAALARDWWTDPSGDAAVRYEKLLVPRSVYAAFGAKLQNRVSRARLID